MSGITEIEKAIEQLPPSQVAELADWLQALRLRRATPSLVEAWLQRACGAAIPGATTAQLLAMTRGDE